MISTLRTLFRASAAEAEEALVDANGTTLLAQHLRDARRDLGQSRQACAALMARKTAEERRIEAITEEITRREQQARDAMAAGQDDLAAAMADRIVILEDQRSQANASRSDLDTRIAGLRENLSEADRRIASVAGDLRAARAGSAARSAMSAVSPSCGPSALIQAEDMANRVRGLDQGRDDLCSAMHELREDPAGLDARMKDAGLGDPDQSRRKAILARLAPGTRQD